jgi:hypothetical protein
MVKKILVISAVNFTEGGPLTILNDCLYASKNILGKKWTIYALVHNKKLINDIEGIKFIELKKSKNSWLYRIYYEYFKFYRISVQLNPDLWISLHDTSPKVRSKKQVVYCHNPSPFFKSNIKHLYYDPKFYLFTKFYRYLYKYNITSNDYVIVQQNWLKEKFCDLFNLKNLIVAHPSITNKFTGIPNSKNNIFFYPSIPRCFKNFEFLCESAIVLADKSNLDFEVRITISGYENRYAKFLKSKYSKYKFIKFIGHQSRSEMINEYSNASVVVFPSLLETWGLPITEAKLYNKRLFIIDLPYARETVGDYYDAHYFDSNNKGKLIELMDLQINNKLISNSVYAQEIEGLYAKDWNSLIKILSM